MAGVIEPGALIGADGIHNERVIIHPAADGVSVPARIGRAGSIATDIFWKLPAVRPDFAPDAVVFGHLDHFSGHLREYDATRHEQDVAREAERIAALDRIVGFADRIFFIRLVLAKLLFAPRRERRDRVQSLGHPAGPESRQIAL